MRVAGVLFAPPAAEEPATEVFLRATGVLALLFTLAGAAWGFVRGMDYPPTVWLAVPEGATIFLFLGMVPAAVVGAVVGLCHRLRAGR